MEVDGISLLENHIRSHPYLKVEDQAVVSKVCLQIRLSEDPGLINSYLREQVEVEASVIYLVGRYSGLVSKLEKRLKESRAGFVFEMGDRSDSGFKINKADKEDTLLATNAKYALQVEILSDMGDLLNVLRGLSTIVFKRDFKLEQLSVNYRIEMRVDSNALG